MPACGRVYVGWVTGNRGDAEIRRTRPENRLTRRSSGTGQSASTQGQPLYSASSPVGHGRSMMGVGMASTLRGRSSSRIRGSELVGLPGPRPSVGGLPGPRPSVGGISGPEARGAGRHQGRIPQSRDPCRGGLPDQPFWLGPGCPGPSAGVVPRGVRSTSVTGSR